jgi:hypothetical protein
MLGVDSSENKAKYVRILDINAFLSADPMLQRAAEGPV